MKQYKSHKIVEAAVISGYTGDAVYIYIYEGEKDAVKVDVPENFYARGFPASGDYLVRYSDGYLSWSPKAAFEDGYTPLDDQPKNVGSALGTLGPDPEWQLRDRRRCALDFALRTSSEGEHPDHILARATMYDNYIMAPDIPALGASDETDTAKLAKAPRPL